jgi:hypothetical protein
MNSSNLGFFFEYLNHHFKSSNVGFLSRIWGSNIIIRAGMIFTALVFAVIMLSILNRSGFRFFMITTQFFLEFVSLAIIIVVLYDIFILNKNFRDGRLSGGILFYLFHIISVAIYGRYFVRFGTGWLSLDPLFFFTTRFMFFIIGAYLGPYLNTFNKIDQKMKNSNLPLKFYNELRQFFVLNKVLILLSIFFNLILTVVFHYEKHNTDASVIGGVHIYQLFPFFEWSHSDLIIPPNLSFLVINFVLGSAFVYMFLKLILVPFGRYRNDLFIKGDIDILKRKWISFIVFIVALPLILDLTAFVVSRFWAFNVLFYIVIMFLLFQFALHLFSRVIKR